MHTLVNIVVIAFIMFTIAAALSIIAVVTDD